LNLEAEKMVRALGTLFAALAGLAFGSFLNVCLSRWPEGESVVKPRSHCRSCARTLAWWENVPVVSWLALRGRCRTCGAWIGWRYPIVELAVGATWSIVAWRYLGQFASLSTYADIKHPPSLATAAILMAFDWVLIGLAVLDAEHLWIPDVVTLPGAVLGLLSDVLYEGSMGSSFVLNRIDWRVVGERLLGILAAAALILLIRWLYWLFRRREGIGLGDAKLMAMLAAWLGLPGALLSFGLGVTLGAFVAVILLIVPSKGNQPGDNPQSWALTRLPLGTFLCIGGVVTSLWGQRIINAYLHWAGF
jgi:leader peptidase (prepilin peptidase)/N-methyltransferase